MGAGLLAPSQWSLPLPTLLCIQSHLPSLLGRGGGEVRKWAQRRVSATSDHLCGLGQVPSTRGVSAFSSIEQRDGCGSAWLYMRIPLGISEHRGWWAPALLLFKSSLVWWVFHVQPGE